MNTDQTLSPLDATVLAALVAAMAASALAGVRGAMYALLAAAGAWLLPRLAGDRPARPAARRPRPAVLADAPRGSVIARLRWAVEATPVGYKMGLLGLAVAMFGLGGDIVWHSTFGVEDGIARVIAPFHLCLFTGAGLLLTSPLRSMWNSEGYRGQLSLRDALPAVLSLALITAMALFLFQWLSAFNEWKPAVHAADLPAAVRTSPAVIQSLQMVVLAKILVTSLILVGAVLLAVRRFRLPFGAITLLFALASLLTAALSNVSFGGSVIAAVAAGLVCDTLIARLRPSAERTTACRAVAFCTAAAFAAGYVIALAVLHGQGLPFDLGLGTIGLTGIAGLALSAIAMPPGA